MSFTNIYRIFEEKVSLFDVDISTQINTLDGMPTRKLSYRKDDRAMRPMYENCRESLTTPTATCPEIFNGLLFRLSL